MNKTHCMLIVLLPAIMYGCSAKTEPVHQENNRPAQTDLNRSRPTPLQIITEDAGDANYLDRSGKLTGYSVQLVRKIMRRLGINAEIQVLSWTRGYRLARNGPRILLFSTGRTAAREKLFKWAGPLFRRNNTLYSAVRMNYRIRNLADAKKVPRIGCTSRDVREQLLLQAGFTNLVPTYGEDADQINLSNLLAGRIDLWATSRADVQKMCRKTGISPANFKQVIHFFPTEGYLAFSRDLPDSLVARWQTALDEIKRDGTYRRIMLQYPEGRTIMTYAQPGPVRKPSL